MCCCSQQAVEHKWFLTGGVPNEAYLSAQPSSSFQGSRFPEENGYFQRPQGSCPPPCQGPQGSVCVSAVAWVTTAKWESMRGEWFSPRPLFIWTSSPTISDYHKRIFCRTAHFSWLDIHKVCRRPGKCTFQQNLSLLLSRLPFSTLSCFWGIPYKLGEKDPPTNTSARGFSSDGGWEFS